MSDNLDSKLPNADMQGAPRALLRAARRAREIAWQTNTPLIIVRDGVLVEEYVTDADVNSDGGTVHDDSVTARKEASPMNDNLEFKLPNADMQGAPRALLRAARRAREIARRTNTPLVIRRDGMLVEEYVTDADVDSDDGGTIHDGE